MELQQIYNYLPIIAVILAWELAWKSIALWKAARNGDKPWFVVLFILNSVGILPIAYIYIFSKRQKPAKS